MNKKMKSLLSNLGIIFVITTISITTVFVEELKAQEATISGWAAMELTDSIEYGIMKPQWLNEDMKDPMTKGELANIVTLVYDKIEKIPGIKKNEVPKNTQVTEKITKRAVLDMLYNIAIEYDYGTDIGLKDKDRVSYMQELEVIRGDGKSLNLDKPCTTEQAILMSRRFIESIYDICDVGSTGLLWKVQKGSNTVYMLGAIHIGNTSMYPMSEEIREAYNESDVVGVEVNINEPIPQEAMNVQFYQDGTTIKDHLSEEYYEKLTVLCKEYNLNMDTIGLCKDWAISNLITTTEMMKQTSKEDISMANADGVDSYWSLVAMMQGKPIVELESALYQFQMMDSMGQELKTKTLESQIDLALSENQVNEEDTSLSKQLLEEMIECWKDGDAEKLNNLVEKDKAEGIDDPKTELEKQAAEYDKAMWETRDTGMTEKIEGFLNAEDGKTYFVTVGAGHYISDTGIIKQLKEKGYEVTQIK